MNNRFTPGFSQSLLFSREEAVRLYSHVITNEHIMLGILRDRFNEAVKIIREFCEDLDGIKKEIEDKMPQNDVDYNINPDELTIDNAAQNVLKTAALEAAHGLSFTVGSRHLLLAILRQKDSIATQVLAERGIEYDKIVKQDMEETDPVKSDFGYDEEEDDSEEIKEPVGFLKSTEKYYFEITVDNNIVTIKATAYYPEPEKG